MIDSNLSSYFKFHSQLWGNSLLEQQKWVISELISNFLSTIQLVFWFDFAIIKLSLDCSQVVMSVGTLRENAPVANNF